MSFRRSQRGVWWPLTASLLIMFTLVVTSLDALGPTFDEQGFLVRGLGYLRGENQHMRVGHPLGLNALNAALLVADSTVHLPTADPSWAQNSFHRPAELFLWEIGNNVEHIMFLARLPTIWLGLLLAALAGRWAWQLTRKRWAALLALGLVAFDPNILAHTRLTTTDLGLTFFAFLAGYGLWWFWQQPSWSRALFTGAAFGLLQNTKFTAGLFIPLFALVILVGLVTQVTAQGWGQLWRGANAARRSLVMLVVAYALVAPFTLWAAYGFQIGTLPDSLPTLPQLGGLTLPLAHHLEQLLDIGGRLQKSTPAFLMGHYSDSGWWYYFPIAFLLKTPLPALLLLGLTFGLQGRTLLTAWRERLKGQGAAASFRRRLMANTALLIPALGYFAIALTTDINLGYRHLLPILPFLYVFIATTLATSPLQPAQGGQLTVYPFARLRAGHSPFTTRLAAFAAIWLLAIALWIHPHYLAYFNVLAGGPNGGWRYLVDSNLDWGQDLGNLKAWMDENGVNRLWLSYFGEGRPDYYGIRYTGLDSWPPRLMDPAARPFYPHDPAPGLYAISATTLQGVHFANQEQFAWFRAREPLAKVGYSIFIYEVEARGEMVELALGDMQLDELAPADFARFQSNQVRPYWFDAATAVLLPHADNRWLALPLTPTLADEMGFTAWWELVTDRTGAVAAAAYRLYRLPPIDEGSFQFPAEFLHEGGMIGLIHWRGLETAVPGQRLRLTTDWFKTSTAAPLKIFIHVTNTSGDIVAQWDGLGAAWQGWRPQSRLWQIHTIPLPADLPTGQYEVTVGIYEPESGARLLTPAGQDAVSLGQLKIEQ